MIKAELLTEVPVSQIGTYTHNPRYAFQEKFNGERRIIVKVGQVVTNYNREGNEGKPLPPAVVAMLRRHELNQFVIDCEYVLGTIHVFDALLLGDQQLVNLPYRDRIKAVWRTFKGFDAKLRCAYTAYSSEDKEQMVLTLAAQHAEGVVAKNLDALYCEGRADQHKKFKFVKEIDVVVMGPNTEGHDSVEIGVYDKGKLRRVAGCSNRFKTNVGDVIIVRYLYASGGMHLVQPRMMAKRTDKRPEDCTLDQLKATVNKNFR